MKRDLALLVGPAFMAGTSRLPQSDSPIRGHTRRRRAGGVPLTNRTLAMSLVLLVITYEAIMSGAIGTVIQSRLTW